MTTSRSQYGSEKSDYLYQSTPVEPPSWLSELRVKESDSSASPTSISALASKLGNQSATPWRSASLTMAKSTSSQSPSARRLVSSIHYSAPDPRYTSKEWRHRENKPDNEGVSNSKIWAKRVFNIDSESEESISKMSSDEVIRMVKEMAITEPSLDSCTHGIQHDCLGCYQVNFTTSSIVSGRKKKIDPRIEMIAKKLNVGRNRNSNYQGTITTFDILNSITLEEENTALYMTGLPADVITKEVYAHIKHGAIHSSSLMPPKSQAHQYSAMRLVFMTHSGAKAFLNQTLSIQGVQIRGRRIKAFWNRERVGPAGLERYRHMSRVLRIEAPTDDMDMEGTVLPLLKQSIRFELISKSQTIATTRHGAEKKVIVLEFSSIRGQADAAYVLLKQLRQASAERPDDIIISFEKDPCDAQRNDLAMVSKIPRSPPLEPPAATLSAKRRSSRNL